jgi:hypothetical protein
VGRTFGGTTACDPIEVSLFGSRPSTGTLGNAGHYASASAFGLISNGPVTAFRQNSAKDFIKANRHPIDVEFLVIEHEASSGKAAEKLRPN